jgi:hypothetical protein
MGEIPIRYNANGTVHGYTELAYLAGESTTSDHGRWWIANNRLCVQWRNWMEGKSYCFVLHRIGAKIVFWRRSDGQSGTARIS